MIVEDETDLQVLYKEILTLSGFEVIGCADNGEEAINRYDTFRDKPDIILMDYRMPKMDGIEAAKEILKINKTQKIIFASADNSIRDEVLSLGCVRFEKKPFRINEIKKTIINIYSDTSNS